MHFRNLSGIASAQGWVANYGNPADGKEPLAYPVAAWALEDIDATFATPGEQRVFGLVYLNPGDGFEDAEAARDIRGTHFLNYDYRGPSLEV